MCSTTDSAEKGYKLPEQILFNFLVLFSTLEYAEMRHYNDVTDRRAVRFFVSFPRAGTYNYLTCVQTTEILIWCAR